MRCLTGLVLLLCLASASGSLADMPQGRDRTDGRYDAEFERRDLVRDSLNLTPAEAKRFWPVYDRFQNDLAAWQQRRQALIGEFGENYDEMTDEAAIRLTLDRLRIEEERSRLMRAYLPEFRRVLPPKKVARYYDIEAKIRAAVNAGIAESIPLMR